MSYTLSIPKYLPIINFEITIPLNNEYAFHFLLGPNGCGKSTLAKSILGINNVGFSSLYENNQDIIEIDSPQLRRYLPQNPQEGLFPQFSLEDNIFLLNKLFDISTPIDNNDIQKLLCVRNTNQQVSSLSVGQKKKLLMHFIIKSLLNKHNSDNYPIIVILDEPFAGIDKTFTPTIQDMLNSVADSFLGSNVYFLIIEHETLLDTSSSSGKIKTVNLRSGVDLRIAYENIITLKK